MKATLFIVLYLINITPAYSHTEDTDFQARLFSHLQYIPDQHLSDKLQLGVASWWIVRDVMDEIYPTANTAVVGPMLIDKDGNWIELMFGRFKGKTKSDLLLDLRFFEQIDPKLSLTGEIGYFPTEETERLYLFLIADTPVKIRDYTFRLGVESENIVSLCNKKDSLGVGPRISFPIPIKGIPGLNTALSFSYEFRNDKNFLRCYVGFNYRF